ncbi:MAG: GerMN domain-containing protein [Oscillospiraceae bacterium]|nr:GerMN domain-containing protein [Oscillospiraceae bacterium]
MAAPTTHPAATQATAATHPTLTAVPQVATTAVPQAATLKAATLLQFPMMVRFSTSGAGMTSSRAVLRTSILTTLTTATAQVRSVTFLLSGQSTPTRITVTRSPSMLLCRIRRT